MYKIYAFTKYSRKGASSRLRFMQYFPFIEQHGFEVINNSLLSDKYLERIYARKRPSFVGIVFRYFVRLWYFVCALRADIVWIEKELFPWLPPFAERLLRLTGTPYVVDYDDAIYHQYEIHRFGPVRWFLGRKVDTIMRYSSCCVVGNSYLAARAEQAKALDIRIIPTVVDQERYGHSDRGEREKEAPFVIGWIGNPSTSKYLEQIRPVLEELLREKDVKLHLVGARVAGLEGENVIYKEWTESTECESIDEFDVGIMPLPDEDWAKGKCGYKLIQYMASGKPVIASPIGVNTEIVFDGACGFLADTQEEWLNALKTLYEKSLLGVEMGRYGRKRVMERYALQVVVPELVSLFRDFVADVDLTGENVDYEGVKQFGSEWQRFDQSELIIEELEKIWNSYFAMFPWDKIGKEHRGADFGCGSGRWAMLVAPRVKELYCIDASHRAAMVCRQNLRRFENCHVQYRAIENADIEDASLDFGYSLGVLHHIPDTEAAIRAIARKMKPGAPFLLYVYYRFDNRPLWYTWLHSISDCIRRTICRLPVPLVFLISDFIAFGIYWPIARFASVCERMGMNVSNFPLESYRNRSLYVIRTDSLDRFGSLLEKRFTREEVIDLLNQNGFSNARVQDTAPYWVAIGERSEGSLDADKAV